MKFLKLHVREDMPIAVNFDLVKNFFPSENGDSKTRICLIGENQNTDRNHNVDVIEPFKTIVSKIMDLPVSYTHLRRRRCAHVLK